ncbi:MAG TPA: hypothetical protein VNH22_20540 [Blastocatellia bacterium]|jgi:hypothetical protein|nr:hypothetical protein [Blastocatellia bacterium]
MDDLKKKKAGIDTLVRKVSPDAIVQRSFYDEASGRMFVTVVQGSRKIDFVLSDRDYNNGQSDKADSVIRGALKKLPGMPIG